MNPKKLFIFIVFIFILTFPINAQVNAQEFSNLTLEDCIKLGIKNNFKIKKATYDVYSAKETTIQIKSQYEPILNCQIGKTDIKNSEVNSIYGTEIKQDSLNIGMNKKFYYTGGTLGLEWSNEKDNSDSMFKSINPSYDSSITLSYFQPIIKNFVGCNDKKSIQIAKEQEKIIELSLILQKNLIANQIENAYRDLNFAQKDLETQKTFLERAKKLLEINKKKLKDGLLEEVDIIATEASVTLRETSILLTENSVKNAEDNLRRIIGLKKDRKCSFKIELPHKFIHKKIIEKEEIEKALLERPDLKIIEHTIKLNSLDTSIKKNEKLPSLDLITQYGLGNTGKTFTDNYDVITNGNNPTWFIGLNFNISPFSKKSNSLLNQNKYLLQKNLLDIEDTKLLIITECKEITRRINTLSLYVEASFKSLVLQNKKLSLEEKKFQQGRSSIQWILNYQDDLTRAKTEHLKALTDYYKAKADLDLITGGTR